MASKIQKCPLRQPHIDNMSLCKWKHNVSAYNLSMSRPEQFSNFDFPEVCLHWKLGNNTSHNSIKTSPQTWLPLGFLFMSSSALNTNNFAATTPLSMKAAAFPSHCWPVTIVPLTHTTVATIQQSQGAGRRQQSETYFRIILFLSNSFNIRIYNSSSLNVSSVMIHYLALLLICKLQFLCCSPVLGRK